MRAPAVGGVPTAPAGRGVGCTARSEGELPAPRRWRHLAAMATLALVTVAPLRAERAPTGARSAAESRVLPSRLRVAATHCEARATLRDRTGAYHLNRRSNTYSQAFVDIDGDGDDDLVVGNHAQSPPALLINEGGRFVDRTGLLSLSGGRDRHGVTVVDLDSDGDRDLLVAGGGGGREQSVPGQPNELVRNLLVERGSLGFERVDAKASGIALRSWRGRDLLPLPSRGGGRVDLYFLAKSRSGRENLYLRNRGSRDLRFTVRRVPGLAGRWSEGSDVPLDHDRDGDVDILLLEGGRARLLANRGGRFEPVETPFDGLRGVLSAAAGDLDGDGYPDIYLGMRPSPDISDHVLVGRDELHYATYGHQEEDRDGFSFVAGETLEVNLTERLGLSNDATRDIFIGQHLTDPYHSCERERKAMHLATALDCGDHSPRRIIRLHYERHGKVLSLGHRGSNISRTERGHVDPAATKIDAQRFHKRIDRRLTRTVPGKTW